MARPYLVWHDAKKIIDDVPFLTAALASEFNTDAVEQVGKDAFCLKKESGEAV